MLSDLLNSMLLSSTDSVDADEQVLWGSNDTKKTLSLAFIVLIVSALEGIGIDTAQSITTTFKWGTVLGDTAAAFEIYRYFLIQLRRWRPFNLCWSESWNSCNKLLPNYIWLQNSPVRENLGRVPCLDAQCFTYSRELCGTEQSVLSVYWEEVLLSQVLLLTSLLGSDKKLSIHDGP